MIRSSFLTFRFPNQRGDPIRRRYRKVRAVGIVDEIPRRCSGKIFRRVMVGCVAARGGAVAG